MKIEYRTPPGTGNYTVLADEAATGVGALQERISGYQPAMRKTPQVEPLFQGPQPFVGDLGNATWTVKFSIDRVHASAAAALAFLDAEAAIFGAVVGAFDLRITVGTTVRTVGNCVLTEFTPSPHSDQSTLISYAFTGASYGA
jgi:hypothetical protein